MSGKCIKNKGDGRKWKDLCPIFFKYYFLKGQQCDGTRCVSLSGFSWTKVLQLNLRNGKQTAVVSVCLRRCRDSLDLFPETHWVRNSPGGNASHYAVV